MKDLIWALVMFGLATMSAALMLLNIASDDYGWAMLWLAAWLLNSFTATDAFFMYLEELQ